MSGPYGRNDPNGQWAQGGNPDPNGGNGAPQFGQPAQPPTQGQPPAQGQPQFGQPPQWAGQPPQWAGQPQQPQPQPQQQQSQWAQQSGKNPDQQWGEQQQWGQQPGQPQWGQQPGQTPAKKSKAPLFIGLGIFVLLLAIAGAVVAGLTLRTNTLDQEAAQAGVAKIVTESYGAEQVEGVSCPAGQELQEGASFECDLTVDGTMKQVTVTFTDDEGTYEVSRPS